MGSHDQKTHQKELDTVSVAEIGASTSDVGNLARRLRKRPVKEVATSLAEVEPDRAIDILERLPETIRTEVCDAADQDVTEVWRRNGEYDEGTVGRLMKPPVLVMRPNQTVGDALDRIKSIPREAVFTYGIVTDEASRLIGVFVIRHLIKADKSAALETLMIHKPFFLCPNMPLQEAMKEVVTEHYPEYPVCNDYQILLGVVRGRLLFERQAIEISAQPGRMVGLDRGVRVRTSFRRCMRFRLPWLQVNLLTAFIAAAVVGFFQDTVDRIVLLAVFLPVLAGQSGNTGCQSLAVTIRGLTLGELAPKFDFRVFRKEALLGFCNGMAVGVPAALAMLGIALYQGNAAAPILAVIVFVAMTVSCTMSCVVGASLPIILKKLGADPASASSIFLTTATDVVSMGAMLGLGTLFVK